jgi:hypothetical protein
MCSMKHSTELIVPDLYAKPVVAVDWMQKHLSFSDEYFSELIGVSWECFSQWKSGRQRLENSQVRNVENLSFALNRLLSFFGFRRDLMMLVLDCESDRHEIRRTSVTPPWLGTSLRKYMLREGSRGIHQVGCWVEKMRSANTP